MNAADTLCLHIGLPKTATTFLQREVFPSFTHIRYLSTQGSNLFSSPQDAEHRQGTLTSAFRRSSLLWERHGDAVFQSLLGCDRPADRLAGPVLLSDEGVGRTGSRPALLAAHLRAVRKRAEAWGFGDVRVLCVLRRQDHWLASHYAQVSDRKPHASQDDFESGVRRILSPEGERFGFGMLLDYAVLAEHVRRAVGPSNLLMLPYEMLNEAPGEFGARLVEFTRGSTLASPLNLNGARKQNVRSTQKGVWILRPARQSGTLRLRPGRLFTALRLPDEVRLSRRTRGGTLKLTESVSKLILQEYELSNRVLINRFGVDLARYGYLPQGPEA